MIPEMILPIEMVSAVGEADVARPALDEDEFRVFYGQHARPVHAYLVHMTGSTTLADDLLQEACLRFLKAPVAEMGPDHRRAYFFRIAANLARDHFRGAKRWRPIEEAPPSAASIGSQREALPGEGLTMDLARHLGRLAPRQREALWLAYVEGASHDEIAQAIGMKSQSIRPMLFRARAKLAGMLRRAGLATAGQRGGESR